jgi:hypothetical protein
MSGSVIGGILCLVFGLLLGALAGYTILSANSRRDVVIAVEIEVEKSQLLVLSKPLRHVDNDRFVASIDERALDKLEQVYIHALTGHEENNSRTNFFMVFEFDGDTEVRLPIGWATENCYCAGGNGERIQGVDDAVGVVSRGLTAAGHPIDPDNFPVIEGMISPCSAWYGSA